MYRQESENIIEITNIEMCDKPVTEYYACKYPDQPGTTGITLQKVNELLKQVQTMQQLTSNVRQELDVMGQELCSIGQTACETYSNQRFSSVKGLDGEM